MIQDTVTEKDLLDTRIMNCVMPRPSEVVHTFKSLYSMNPKDATDYFYNLNISILTEMCKTDILINS